MKSSMTSSIEFIEQTIWRSEKPNCFEYNITFLSVYWSCFPSMLLVNDILHFVKGPFVNMCNLVQLIKGTKAAATVKYAYRFDD